MFRVSKDYVTEVIDGVFVPDVFVGYRLLVLLMESESARVQFLGKFRKDVVAVELFKEENDRYVASVVDDFEIPDSRQLEGVGFCEKL